MRLFHSVDNNSTKSEKYLDHGTAIIKLVPEPIRKVLLKLASEPEDVH